MFNRNRYLGKQFGVWMSGVIVVILANTEMTVPETCGFDLSKESWFCITIGNWSILLLVYNPTKELVEYNYHHTLSIPLVKL